MSRVRDEPTCLDDAVRLAGDSLLCFVLPGLLCALPTRFGKGRWPVTSVTVGIALVLPVVVVLLLVAHLVTGAETWNFFDWYVIYYFFLNLALMLIPQDAWRRLQAMASDVDAMICDHADRALLARRVAHAVRIEVQIALLILGFAAGCAAAVATVSAHHTALALAAPFEASIGVTIALGANVVSWIALGMYWLWAYCRLPSVRYDSIDQMRSPGLQAAYGLLSRGQWYCTLGLVLALAPLAVIYSDTRYSHFLGLTLLMAGGGSVLLVVLAYTVPPWLLHSSRARDRDALLGELRVELPTDLTAVDDHELCRVMKRLELYARVQARPTGRADRTMATSLLLSIATVSAAFIPLLLGK